MNKLKLTLPSDTEILIERMFNAPPTLVFEALTKPEHLVHWWGSAQMETIVEVLDFRVGGSYRIVQKDEEGNECPCCGEYREIKPGSLIVQTFIFDTADYRDDIAIETLEFNDVNSLTLLRDHLLFESREARDKLMDLGMEEGARETFDRLDIFLGTDSET